MAWQWQYLRTDGMVDQSLEAEDPPTFSTQADAESWIGEEWQTLLKSGVEAVTLMEDDREVYGPMSLHPPAESPQPAEGTPG
jgi:predicted metal-dependent peptidase